MISNLIRWLCGQKDLASDTLAEAKATKLRSERRITSHEQTMKGWGFGTGDPYIQYFCTNCGGELTPGPSGGGTNQVCEKCRINYGCLPGALER